MKTVNAFSKIDVFQDSAFLKSGLKQRFNPRWLTSVCTGAFLLLFMVLAQKSQAQLILMPGQTYENIAAAGSVIANTGETPPPPPGTASTGYKTSSTVSFDRADSLTQNIRLFAGAQSSFRTQTAIARGMLYVDFCVPIAGSGTCDAPPDPTASDVTASITFGYGIVGSVTATGIGSKASFAASGAVIDLGRSAYVNYQKLDELSVAGINAVKVVKKVPIPLPDFASAETTQPVTFTSLLKRGHTYRFQLAGASTAQSGIASNAYSDFYSERITDFQRGRIQLHNLTIQVSQDNVDTSTLLKELKDLIASLQDQVGNLAGQLDNLREELQGDTDALRQEIEALTERTDISGSFLMLPVGSPAPEGYTFISNFKLVPSHDSNKHQVFRSVALFWKGDPEELPVRQHKKKNED